MAVVLMENNKDAFLHPAEADDEHEDEIHSINEDEVQSQYPESCSYGYQGHCTSSEIEEVVSEELFEIGTGAVLQSIQEEDRDDGSLFSYDFHGRDETVYVAVGKDDSSMDALVWTLENAIVDPSSTFVYLIHVFPEVKSIPTPLGNLQISKVAPDQVESFMAQENGKRRGLLHQFMNLCHASKVKVDTILIESNNTTQAILDLVPVLNIKKLVIGTSKSYMRKPKSKKSVIADHIVQNVPEYCDVKVICEKKQVIEQKNSEVSSPRLELGIPRTSSEQGEKIKDSKSSASPQYDLRSKSPASPRIDLKGSKSAAAVSPRTHGSFKSPVREETFDDSKSVAGGEKFNLTTSWICFKPKVT